MKTPQEWSDEFDENLYGQSTYEGFKVFIKEIQDDAKRVKPYENCRLVAAHGGDGWSLEAHTQIDGQLEECVAMLAWPEAWPKTMTTEQLEKCGFECV